MNYSVYRNKNEEKNGKTMAHRYGECYKVEEEGYVWTDKDYGNQL